MLPFFLPQLNFHLHMIQNRIRVISLAVHLQFYCYFFSFHFSCAISTQTLPCLKCRSFDRSICIRPFPVSLKRSQPAFVFGIKFTMPIVNAVSPLTFWIHLRHNKQDQSWINFTLRAIFPSWFHLLRGGRHSTPGKPHWMRGYLDELIRNTEFFCYKKLRRFWDSK